MHYQVSGLIVRQEDVSVYGLLPTPSSYPRSGPIDMGVFPSPPTVLFIIPLPPDRTEVRIAVPTG